MRRRDLTVDSSGKGAVSGIPSRVSGDRAAGWLRTRFGLPCPRDGRSSSSEPAIIGLTWDPAGALAWQVTAQTHVEADASNSEYAKWGRWTLYISGQRHLRD